MNIYNNYTNNQLIDIINNKNYDNDEYILKIEIVKYILKNIADIDELKNLLIQIINENENEFIENNIINEKINEFHDDIINLIYQHDLKLLK